MEHRYPNPSVNSRVSRVNSQSKDVKLYVFENGMQITSSLVNKRKCCFRKTINLRLIHLFKGLSKVAALRNINK